MKKALILLVLLLTSCITVDNPGPFWNKADVDPNLFGKWVVVSSTDNGDEADLIYIYDKGKTLGIDEYKENRKIQHDNLTGSKQHSIYKTIEVGPYHFLLIKYEDASMIMLRYEVKDKALTVYKDRPGYIEYFIKKNFPQELDIAVKDYGLNNVMSEKYIEIYHMTDAVLKILAEIPNDAIHWEMSNIYEKVP